MQKTRTTLILAAVLGASLLSTATHAQGPPFFNQNIPANTVVGRLGSGQAGTAQAIPLSSLFGSQPSQILIGATTPTSPINIPSVQIGNDWIVGNSYIVPSSSDFQVSALQLFNSNPGGDNITSYERTSTIGGAGLSISSFCYADNSSARGCWPWYSEGHRLTHADYSYGLGEVAAVNRFNDVLEINPLNVLTAGQGSVLGEQIDCGNGSPIASYTLYSCSAGIIFTNNLGSGQTSTTGFAHGIVFRSVALDTTLFNPPDAIALPTNPRYAISFWSSGSNRAWLVYSDAASGNNTFNMSTGVIINSAHLSNGGGGPTNSACTGFTLATGSTDSNGTVSFNSATSCAIAFNVAYTNPPFCVVAPGSAASTVKVSTTTGVLTATFGTANTSMSWQCLGQ